MIQAICFCLLTETSVKSSECIYMYEQNYDVHRNKEIQKIRSMDTTGS